MPTKPKILVTSAGGHVGQPTVLTLREMGFPVRAFVRRVDHRSERMKQAGAEIHVGNQQDIRHLRTALQGVQRALHCPPFSPNTLYDSTLFAAAAEEARLETVVLMTAWNVHEAHPSIHQRGHWISRKMFDWMPTVGTVHLTPGFFAFDYFLGLPAIVHFGQLMMPLGNGRNAPPANEDIAAVAAHILADPAPHIGKVYRPTGPKLLTPQDIAGTMAQVLNRKVVYKDTSFRNFQKAALALGYPLSQIAHVRYYAEEFINQTFATGAPTDHVEAVTGRPPEPFIETARRYFQNPDLIYPGLRAGSKREAFSFLLRMMMTRPRDLEEWERQRGYPLIDQAELAHESAVWRDRARAFPTRLAEASAASTARGAHCRLTMGSETGAAGGFWPPSWPEDSQIRRSGSRKA